MGLSKKPYKGTRDFFPNLQRVQNYLFQHLADVAERFGYEPYNGPLLEEVDLYLAKSGEELIGEQIYSFHDRGERFVAIRPEMTPTLARMVAQVYREVPKPIRWYSIPNLYRYEQPQRGRLREHWQFNIDVFGAPGSFGELEILEVLIEVFRGFGANSSHFEIGLNDRRFVDAVIKDKLKLNQEQAHRAYKAIDRFKKLKPDQFRKYLQDNGLEQLVDSELFNRYLTLKSFQDLEKFASDFELISQTDTLMQLHKHFCVIELENYLTFDPQVVRGLDYYTGIVFEAFDKHPDNRRALCGGGAYANLLQIFDEGPLEGIGLGLGDVTLKDFLESHGLLPNLEKPSNDYLVTSQIDGEDDKLLQIARALRSNGNKVIFFPGHTKFKKVFSLAEKFGAKNVVFFGENEKQNNSVQIKNVQSGEQKNIALADLSSI